MPLAHASDQRNADTCEQAPAVVAVGTSSMKITLKAAATGSRATFMCAVAVYLATGILQPTLTDMIRYHGGGGRCVRI